MGKIKKIIKILLVLSLFSILSISCSYNNSSGKYIVGIAGIKTLNPFLSSLKDERTINFLIYGSLFYMKNSFSKFEPFIAKKFTVFESKILIEVNDNIFDSDGNSINARFLVKYFNFMQNKSLNDDESFIPNIKGLIIEEDENNENNMIIKFDDKLSQVERMQKVGHLFTFPILSPEVFEKIEEKQENFYKYANFEDQGIPVVSTGKWSIKEINFEYIEIEKNQKDKSDKIKKERKTIVFKMIKDKNQILQDLINKKIDICFGDELDARFLQNFYTVKKIKIDDPESFYALFFNFQSSNIDNKKIFENINFRKIIYNIINNELKINKLNQETYVTPAHIIKKRQSPINKNYLKEVIQKNNRNFSLFAISDDSFALSLMQNLNDILTKKGLNITAYSENLNNMIARIYATKNWDFFITTLSIDYPFLVDFELYDPFSFQHLFNINLDKNIDFILSFESELYNKIEQNAELIIKSPIKIYKEIEEQITKNYYFVPLMEDKVYLFYNRKIKIKKAEVINKGFFIYNLFD